jgi:hypothetical protein
VDYQAFGEAFIYRAVTPDRIVEAVTRIAGDVVELGPIRAGPGGRATVHAKGRLGEPEADEAGSDPLVYLVRLPVDVDLEVRVGTLHHYRATGSIDLRLSVLVAEPLRIAIETDPVRPKDVHFDIEAQGMQAKLLGRAGDVDGELRRHTAEYVNERVLAPETSRFTNIDLLPLMDRVWADL